MNRGRRRVYISSEAFFFPGEIAACEVWRRSDWLGRGCGSSGIVLKSTLPRNDCLVSHGEDYDFIQIKSYPLF